MIGEALITASKIKTNNTPPYIIGCSEKQVSVQFARNIFAPLRWLCERNKTSITSSVSLASYVIKGNYNLINEKSLK